jgi:hypothetical protein
VIFVIRGNTRHVHVDVAVGGVTEQPHGVRGVARTVADFSYDRVSSSAGRGDIELWGAELVDGFGMPFAVAPEFARRPSAAMARRRRWGALDRGGEPPVGSVRAAASTSTNAMAVGDGRQAEPFARGRMLEEQLDGVASRPAPQFMDGARSRRRRRSARRRRGWAETRLR